MGLKTCDSCKTTPADLFCRVDSAFLCVACDGEVHAANKLASRHDRAWLSDQAAEAEAEAASWLNKTPHEEDDPKVATEYSNYWFNADGVVPVGSDNKEDHGYGVVDGLPAAYDMPPVPAPPFMYHFTCQPVASSSAEIEAGVVPEGEASNHQVYPSALSGSDREARVLRYREKKKNRKFDKTIRYASRKAYAETRPRIKGRFAKRSDEAVASYGLVPSY